MLDGQQNVIARYLYDPFGNLLAMDGPLATANLYRFSSKEFHANGGLYYYGFRFYEPNLQRWLNQDPIGEAGGINLYRFVMNNPATWVDTDGLQPANVAVVRPGRPSQSQGAITEEILRSLRNNRNYRPTTEERFYERAKRDKRDAELRQRFPGHQPSQTYLVQGPIPKPPCPPNSLSNRNAPSLRIDGVAKTIEEYLGGPGRIIRNSDGDVIIMRGEIKIRFDINDPHGDRPHFHIERQTPGGKWKDAGGQHRYYFE